MIYIIEQKNFYKFYRKKKDYINFNELLTEQIFFLENLH